MSSHPGGSAPSASTGANRRANTESAARHAEGNLSRSWRQVIQALTVVASKAEKASSPPQNHALQQELLEKTKEFLVVRKEFEKTVTNVSDCLEGKAAEMECLHHYVRTHPSLGKRKRVEIITLD